MQTKTIEKTIRKKLNEWLESITDKTLAHDLKPNILVSGGSITSMLLNEKINDYDIYIKDRNILMRLVKYYTNGMNDIEILDGEKKNSYITGNDNNSYSVSVRTLKPDQIKLFFPSEKGGIKIDKENIKEGQKYTPLYFSPNAISLSDKIQIVIRFHGDNEQIHKTFDFIHATNYFTFEDGLVTNKEALESILTKQLKYQGSLYPVTTIIRVKKFIKRGWNINAGELLKVMFQISELDLKNIDVLEEQILGVDVCYFGKLVELLRNDETLKTTPLSSIYLNGLIDKVFNEYGEDDNENEE